MQMAKSKAHLHSEEFGLVFWELPDLDQVPEKFSPLDERHQEVDPEFVLKHIFHINQEGVIDRVENVFFQLNVLHLFVL